MGQRVSNKTTSGKKNRNGKRKRRSPPNKIPESKRPTYKTTEEEVEKAINKLETRKAAGDDEITGEIINKIKNG